MPSSPRLIIIGLLFSQVLLVPAVAARGGQVALGPRAGAAAPEAAELQGVRGRAALSLASGRSRGQSVKCRAPLEATPVQGAIGT